MAKDLTPRDGAKIPKQENLTAAEKAVMEQVAELTKSETVAFAMLAKEQQMTRVAVEDCADRLQAIMDMFVKTLLNFNVALPAAIVQDMGAIDDDGNKVYDPDALPEDDEDEGEDEGEGDDAE